MAKQYRYHYVVTGRGQFPFDMLRYDRCWPSDDTHGLGVSRGDPGYGEVREIKMAGLNPPTEDRWASFLWYVKRDSLEKRDVS